MTASKSIEMIQRLAEKRRDECACRLGKAMVESNEAQARMQLLVDYRADYAARLEAAVFKGIPGGGLRNYQTFLENLERAIEQQAATLEQLQAVVQRVRAEVIDEQRRMESFAVMLRRQAGAQAVIDNRRQQSLQDEFSTNNVIRLALHRDRGGD